MTCAIRRPRCCSRGLEAALAQCVLGHRSITITNDTYLHLMPQVKQQAAEMMDALRRGSADEGEQSS